MVGSNRIRDGIRGVRELGDAGHRRRQPRRRALERILRVLERDFERAKFRKRDERLGQHLGASPRVRFDVVHVEHRRVVVVVVIVSSVVHVASREFVRGSSFAALANDSGAERGSADAEHLESRRARRDGANEFRGGTLKRATREREGGEMSRGLGEGETYPRDEEVGGGEVPSEEDASPPSEGEREERGAVHEAETTLEADELDGVVAALVHERLGGGRGDAVAPVEDDLAEVRESREGAGDGLVGGSRACEVQARATGREGGERRQHRLLLRLGVPPARSVALRQALGVHADRQARAAHQRPHPGAGRRERREVRRAQLRQHALEHPLLHRVDVTPLVHRVRRRHPARLGLRPRPADECVYR